MSNRAWMPLHIDDYIRDTDHLSATEHGAYLLLIMKYWRDSGLPEDEGLIRRYAKLSVEQWAESRDVLAALFDAGWRHKRIDAELSKAAEIIEKRKSAGKKTQFSGKSSANAEQMPEQMPSKSSAPLTFNQEEDSEPSGSGAAAPIDPRDELWSNGLVTLKAISGKTDAAARQLLGKWVRDAKDDCSLVLSKIRTAQTERIGEPISWITAALKPQTGPPPKGVSAAAKRIIESENNGSEGIFGNHGNAQRLPAAGGGGSRNAASDLPGGIGRQYLTIDH